MIFRFDRKLRFPNIRFLAKALEGAEQTRDAKERLGKLLALRERAVDVLDGIGHASFDRNANLTMGFLYPAALMTLAGGIFYLPLAIAGGALAMASLFPARAAYRQSFALMNDRITTQREIDRDLDEMRRQAPGLKEDFVKLHMLYPAFQPAHDKGLAFKKLVEEAGDGPAFETPPPPKRVPQHIEKAKP